MNNDLQMEPIDMCLGHDLRLMVNLKPISWRERGQANRMSHSGKRPKGILNIIYQPKLTCQYSLIPLNTRYHPISIFQLATLLTYFCRHFHPRNVQNIMKILYIQYRIHPYHLCFLKNEIAKPRTNRVENKRPQLTDNKY